MVFRTLVFWSFVVTLPFVWQYVSQTFDGFEPEAIKGLNVLVCGASTGIGEEMAYKYASMGANVAILARRKAQLETVAAKAITLGANSVHVIDADVGSVEGSRSAIERTLSAFDGQLDVLVLNHVVGFWGWWLPPKDDLLSENTTIGYTNTAPHPTGKGLKVWNGVETVNDIFNVNVFSYVHMATFAMPALARSGATGGPGGQLVVVTSAAGKLGLPKVAPYSASKHALHGFFDSLRIELKSKNIPVSVTITVIGNIDTANNKNNVGDDLANAPAHHPADLTAEAIIRAGATRQRELYYPLGQGLHAMAVIRPFLMDTLDRIVIALMVA